MIVDSMHDLNIALFSGSRLIGRGVSGGKAARQCVTGELLQESP